jgi:peptidoglycan/xylan/chitin deacetylase (PgdA/CDA1 family)
MKNLIKNLVCGFLSFFPFKGVVILMYHSVAENKEFFTVRPEEFKRQMDYLYKQNFKVIGLEKLVEYVRNKKEVPPKTIVLTFDDGYEDNYLTAFSVLKQYGFPATIFLATGLLGNKSYTNKRGIHLPMLDWSQIKEMHNSGLIDFQPHTMNHPKLSQINIDEARKEISDSKMFIEKELNKQCRFFAYPYGDFNKDVKYIISQYFDVALSIKKGRVGPNSDFLELPRNSIDSQTSFIQFKGIIKFGRI